MSESVLRMIRCAAPMRALYVSHNRMVTTPVKMPVALKVSLPVILFLAVVNFALSFWNLWSPSFYLYAGVAFVLGLSASGGLLLYMRSSWKKAEKNISLPADRILENSGGSQILVSEVISLEFRKGTSWKTPVISISDNKGKHLFVLHAKETKNQDAIIEDFRRLFGDRLSVR